MEGNFLLLLVWVGWNAELIQPVWGVVAQLQSGENKIFYHLGDTGSELKLTDFQEKSGELKSSILVPRLALQTIGAGDGSHTSPLRDHFGKLA
jgi:hypothetical protein